MKRRTHLLEELGIGVDVVRLLRVDAVPYVPEEPGPYRLDFYYLCVPEQGFGLLRGGLASSEFTLPSPEITEIRMVAISALQDYDLFSADARFLSVDLPRLVALNPVGSQA